jgi:hypothetical protein
MATAVLTSERMRDLLSHTILEILDSWPDVHREVFVRAHYWGDSVEFISGTLGMEAEEVRFILEQCDRRLRTALRPFRREPLETDRAAARGAESSPVTLRRRTAGAGISLQDPR